jgi:signal transduction histidine kinase
MKAKVSYPSTLIIRILLLVTLGFILISVFMWLYFRNEMRDIGYYLRFGRREEIATLVAEYLGDPPSRLKARLLAQSYDLVILYRVGGKIQWGVERSRLFRPRAPDFPDMQEMMMRMMQQGGRGMLGRPQVQRVVLASNRVLVILFPPPLHHGRHAAPLFLFVTVAALIGLILYFFLRRTFSPLDKIIEASEVVGSGDLSYRIEHGRNDDFGKVASAFNSMAARLSGLISNQRDLLHVVSHELRTPLTRIRLALELKDRVRADKIIKAEVHEIDDLVQAVSELSRLDGLDRELNLEQLYLDELIRTIIEEHPDRVEYRVEPGDHLVLANPFLLKKIFTNLIDNGLKYGIQDEAVRVTLAGEGEELSVSIESSGPGIPETELSRIWEPFFRGSHADVVGADVAGISGHEGRGLGLVVVQKAVELCGGRVGVKSSGPGPTVFTVVLPRGISDAGDRRPK